VGGRGVCVPVEMVLIRDGVQGKEVFLARRPPNDPNWANLLHLPGTYIQQGETELEVCARIAKREVPGVVVVSTEIIDARNNVDNPRFHDLSVVVLTKFEGQPTSETAGGWFPVNQPPLAEMIEIHQKFWPTIQRHVNSAE